MRILVATDQWWPDVAGGVARVAAETAERLAARGHDVTVLAPRGASSTVENDGRLAVHRTLARSRLPQTLTDVVETARAARGLAGPGFDLLLAHQATTAGGLVAARIDAPLALVFHASAFRELRFLRSRVTSRLARAAAYPLEPPLFLLEKLAARRSGRIILLSEFSRSILLSDHPRVAQAVRKVAGGVDIARFSPGDGQAAARSRLGLEHDLTPLLLTVRRLEARMGVENLLVAVAQLRRTVPASLAVAGAGPLLPELRRAAAALGLGDAVSFLGRVSDDELTDWYRAADLFVLPTVAYEGFGLVTAEALASGTPVVGTPVGATPELLTPLEPRLVSAGTDPVDLVAALTAALELTGPELRGRCRDYACAQFSWDRAIEEWERVLVEQVEERHG